MHKITLAVLLFSILGFSQNIQFSDPDLLVYLTTKVCVDTNADNVFDSDADINNDGQIQYSEAAQVVGFTFSTVAHGIQSIGGFEHFENLQRLTVTTIQIPSLDTSIWPDLQYLKLSSTIPAFTFNNPALTQFVLENTGFTNPVFNLTNLPNLEYVRVQSSFLTDNLIFGTHNNLEELRILAGSYSTLNLSGMPALKYLTIEDFTGSTLDISNCTVLEEFAFRYNNNLHTLIGSDASPALATLDFIMDGYEDTASNLDLVFDDQALVDVSVIGVKSFSLTDNTAVAGNVVLWKISEAVTVSNCEFGYISSLLDGRLSINNLATDQIALSDISGVQFLTLNSLPLQQPIDLSTVTTDILSIFDSNITELILKNGHALQSFGAYNTPIQFICVDRSEIETVTSGYDNVEAPAVINPYCSFTLGGDYHEISGNILVDSGSGCSNNTYGPVFNLQLSASNGLDTDMFYADSTNGYSHTLPEGSHVVSSQLVDLEHWIVNPPTVEVTFPNAAEPYIQDFCITPAETFSDVEVYLMAVNPARPGFEADYKLIYRNKGNTSVSGSLSLAYNDDVSNFVESSPATATMAPGSLSWNYTDLHPFESREIEFTLLMNTPTDPDFPLNGGDTVTYSAAINSVPADQQPGDNTFNSDQVLVNSYDPNDITCMQGPVIALSHVGDYVHYRIRFENTGSATAANIVVKEVVDTGKFDITTLIPLGSSHGFRTEVVNGNEVEFIFEGIDLPFNDANNDGYVAYKIRTLPTLSVGDSFSAQAQIYFDHNFPIVTNMATTVVSENLATPGFTRSSIALYPNPANAELTITSHDQISGIAVYDLNGRKVSHRNGVNAMDCVVDVSALAGGMYFIEVQHAGAKEVLKFVKE
ncbi:MAG TPA: T9SS type A sorting domain-containing protein [Flavobacterium sp.]|jgi:hypothetical protein